MPVVHAIMCCHNGSKIELIKENINNVFPSCQIQDTDDPFDAAAKLYMDDPSRYSQVKSYQIAASNDNSEIYILLDVSESISAKQLFKSEESVDTIANSVLASKPLAAICRELLTHKGELFPFCKCDLNGDVTNSGIVAQQNPKQLLEIFIVNNLLSAEITAFFLANSKKFKSVLQAINIFQHTQLEKYLSEATQKKYLVELLQKTYREAAKKMTGIEMPKGSAFKLDPDSFFKTVKAGVDAHNMHFPEKSYEISCLEYSTGKIAFPPSGQVTINVTKKLTEAAHPALPQKSEEIGSIILGPQSCTVTGNNVSLLEVAAKAFVAQYIASNCHEYINVKGEKAEEMRAAIIQALKAHGMTQEKAEQCLHLKPHSLQPEKNRQTDERSEQSFQPSIRYAM